MNQSTSPEPSSLQDQVKQGLGDLFRKGPLPDLEKNLKAFLSHRAHDLGFVTQEAFDQRLQQIEILAKRIQDLETKLAHLQASQSGEGGT